MNHILTIRTDDDPEPSMATEVFTAHVGDLDHLDLALIVLTAIKEAKGRQPKTKKRRSDAGKPRGPKTEGAAP